MTGTLDVPQGVRIIPRFTYEVTQGMTIAQAIAHADTIGGDWTILVYPGTYDEGDLTPNGGADITIKAMGEGRVVIAPVAAPAVAVIVSGFTLTLQDIVVTAPDATMPALAVIGGTVDAKHCNFNGVGAGDSIDMTAGTLNMDSCAANVDIELSTAPCTLNCWDSPIFGGINTAAEAVAHAITLYNCDMNNTNIVSASTAGTTVDLYGCTQIGTVNNSGTGAFTIRESDVAVINNVNAAGTVILYGGYLHDITRAVGSVVWWQDDNTLKVIACGTITDTVIQWAINAAGAGDTVVFHPGTYEEAVTFAAGINLVGIDKEACIIDIDHATLITMAAGCRVANLTLNVTGDGTGNGIGVELNDAACTIEDINISLVRTGSNAYGISEQTGGTSREIYIRNVRIVSDTDTNESGIYCDQANKTFYIEESWIQGGDRAIYCDADSLFYIGQSHIEINVIPPGGGDAIFCATATMHFRGCIIFKQISVGNLGTVRLIDCHYREINRSGTGNIVDESPDLKDAPWHVQRWNWLAALANAQVIVRGTPIDAGTGQVLLEVTDNGADEESVESGAEGAGSLSNKLTPARTPRFLAQIAVDSFDANVTMFFGLRETLGDDVPAATEDHAGFIWDGTNFKASSDDGVGIQETNLTTPSTDAQHQLEVIVFGGVTTVGWVEFYVDGILVATHNTRIPVQDLDWQQLLETAGGGGGDAIDVTLRNGGVQQCPA